MISRAELLARIHDPNDEQADRNPELHIDLSAYAERYGFELADLARRALGLLRFERPPLRILELHPGPVAMASALVGPKVCALEPQADAARQLAADGVEVHSGRFPEQMPSGRFDLVLAAGVLSSFSEHDLRQEVADKLAELLAPQGQILVLEQGNRLGGRCIVALRAGLIRSGVQPIAPCPHQGSCPLSEQRRKGCSFPTDEPRDEFDEAVDPGGDELSLLLAGRGGVTRNKAPFVLARAKRDGDAIVLPVCHEQFSMLRASIAEHTRRGGGLYRQSRGSYVDVPTERLELDGGLLPGPPLQPGHHLLDEDAGLAVLNEP